MKPGDVVMVYMDPQECTTEAGPATLIEKIKEFPNNLEQWLVSYINRPVAQVKVLIKNEDGKNET
jgi:hypothetical protein